MLFRSNRTLGLYYINLAEKAEKKDDEPGFFGKLFGSKPTRAMGPVEEVITPTFTSACAALAQATLNNNVDTAFLKNMTFSEALQGDARGEWLALPTPEGDGGGLFLSSGMGVVVAHLTPPVLTDR